MKKITEMNTIAIKLNTIVMLISIIITIIGQVVTPARKDIEIKNSTVNINIAGEKNKE